MAELSTTGSKGQSLGCLAYRISVRLSDQTGGKPRQQHGGIWTHFFIIISLYK